MADANLRELLNIATVLNSRLAVQNQQDLQSRTFLKKDSIQGKKVVLEDIKDATETFNREFMEREKDVESNLIKDNITTLQDYSLVVLFSGFGLFVLVILEYIIRNSKAPVLLGLAFLILISVIYVFLVFMIQRYG